MKQENKNNNKEVDQYIKRSFISRLPFGVKATFIKYWFYGALYFFCFMGLGLTGIPNENLVLVTGLIGGVLFDIALYNIFLLFAETREEASQWWFFKSKKFYSIFINVILMVGILFAFYYIIVPIKAAMGKNHPLWWIFQEPFSAALLLTILDTAVVWIKNLLIKLFKKLFISKDSIKRKASYINILDVSPVSVTIRLDEKTNYHSLKPYNVILDNDIILKKETNNVLTIYDLKPDTQYKLTINRITISFTTPKISKFYKVFEGNDIQDAIDNADQYSLIVVNKGEYQIKTLTLKNNITLYFRKGVSISVSDNKNDYPLMESSEIEMVDKPKRKPIINIEQIDNVKIIGEGVIDATNQSKNKDANSSNLIYLNHANNVSLIGLTLKNSSGLTINNFYSKNINLFNLNIKNQNDFDGVGNISSSYVNIEGCYFSHCKNALTIKSISLGKNNISNDSNNINVTNIKVENSLSSVLFGEENLIGINSVYILNSIFNNNQVGIFFKTTIKNKGYSSTKNINVSNIEMNDVITPIIFYNIDDDSSLLPSQLPALLNFNFSHLEVKDYQTCAGYFHGFNKKYLNEIKIENSIFVAKETASELIIEAINDNQKYCKNGFVVDNVRSFNIKEVTINNIEGERVIIKNVSEVMDN